MSDTADSQNNGSDDKSLDITVPDEARGMRLDQFVSQKVGEHSRAFFQRLIQDDCITVNGASCRRSRKLKEGDVIHIDYPEEDIPDIEGEKIDFGILYEDDHILVINKPPSLVVHPAAGNLTGTLVHGLLHHDEETFADMTDDTLRPGIVHRLDKDTSGVMVVAKSLESRRFLKQAFKERDVEKTYLTVVLGEFGAVTGTIRNEIGRNPRNRQKMAVVPEGGKLSLTTYRVLGTNNGCSLLEVRIFTGRTHQIRVHFSHLNHPVLGDRLYGGLRTEAPHRPPRQLLHAWKLVIPHPATGVKRQYMAPLPSDFLEALEALGLPDIGREKVMPVLPLPP